MADATGDDERAGPGDEPSLAAAGEPTAPARPRNRRRVLLAAGAALVLVVVASLVVAGRSEPDQVETTAAAVEPGTTSTTHRARAATPLPSPTTTTSEPAPVPEPDTAPATEPEPTTAAPAPPTTTAPVVPATRAPAPAAPPPAAAAVPPFPSVGYQPFIGLGAWVDVLDWSPTFTGGGVSVTPATVDALADRGVQTLYIQTSRFNRPEDVLDPALLNQFISRAHARGLRVVGWYLPTHVDPDTDLRRLLAAAALPVDGVGVDIESTAQTDLAARNQHLIDLSVALRSQTSKPLAAIVLPPVVTELLNRSYWPNFPWTTIAGLYDAFLPMAYWSTRTTDSGWRDGYRYIAENTTMLRRLTGRADLPVHPVGGIANEVTVDEVNGMALALADTGAIGGSVYDVATTGDALWPSLHNFRR